MRTHAFDGGVIRPVYGEPPRFFLE
jgi:hypothetical protein